MAVIGKAPKPLPARYHLISPGNCKVGEFYQTILVARSGKHRYSSLRRYRFRSRST